MRRPAVSASPGWVVMSLTMVLAFSVRVSMTRLPIGVQGRFHHCSPDGRTQVGLRPGRVIRPREGRGSGRAVWQAGAHERRHPAQDRPDQDRRAPVQGDQRARGSAADRPRGDPDFTPVELLLAALAGCGAIDLDHITGKRAEALSFAATTEAHKIRDEQGNRLVDLKVTFDVRFPDGEAGDAARQVIPRALGQIRERLCTVGRTVAVGTPVEYVEAD